MPQYSFTSSRPVTSKLLDDYLYNTTPISKGNRNVALFQATCQARDCDWDKARCLSELFFKATSRDGLPDNEARATIESVWTKEHRDPPHGARPEIPRSRMSSSSPERVQKVTEYIFDPEFKLPAPIENAPIAYLEALYRPGERIYMVSAKMDESKDKETPDFSEVHVWDRDMLLKVLREKVGGFLAPVIGEKLAKRGLYINLNPIGKTTDRRVTENISDYRYMLLEFDAHTSGLSIGQQIQVVQQSKIPFVAVVGSGHHSGHFVIPVNCGLNADLFKARVDVVLEHFKPYGLDPNTKDVCRLSRFPGVTRCDFDKGKQELLLLKGGLDTWEEWEREIMVEQDGLPAIEDMFDMIADIDSGKLVEPKEVIVGVAHESCKLVIGGASKAKKTWALADLAVSVMSGGLWFKWLPCNQGNVLYLNMELPKYFMGKRVQAIAAAKGVKIDKGMFKVINLRGFAADLAVLRPRLEAAIGEMKFSLILLDPTYKLMPGGDENGTSDSSMLLNEIERLAVKSGALCAFASHYSKGGQAHKNVQDRLSGSGVFARDPDSIILMTEHVEDMALSVDFVLRNHAPQKPFVISWEYPLFTMNPDLNPADLKQDKKPGAPLKTEDSFIMSPGKKKKIKEWLDANPTNSQRDFGTWLAENKKTLWNIGFEKAKSILIPWLETICIEQFEGTKSGNKTTSYRFIETVKSTESKAEKVDSEEPF